MNLFRFLGDFSHFVAIIILLTKMWKTRSCAGWFVFILCVFSGISGKAQIAFAIVFSTRYLDLFTSFISVYNTVAKILFIASAYATLYLMFFKFEATYDSNHDTFRLEFLLVPCGILALVANYHFSVFEVCSFLPSANFRCSGLSRFILNRSQFSPNCS